MANKDYNPDVLNCIANLSNDEVFTPPALANQVIDMLPKELFSDPKATFVDPFCKSGVFLREIVKRLDKGLAEKIPDQQKRIDHIMHHQVFGIALTELTSLLSRRTLYCSKCANSQYSVTHFDNEQGNVFYKPIKHTWVNGKCKYCGASKEVYDRGSESEQYAYQFIHTDNPKKLFPKNMKFDVIIGNPPYQLSDGGNAASAMPIYQLFVEQAKKLNPRFLCMIIPARWYAGGRGLDDFRTTMLNDNHISHLVDFPDSRDCFPNVNIAGGVCYFLWKRDEKCHCEVINISAHETSKTIRNLNQFPVFVRANKSISIINKVMQKDFESISKEVCSSNPFGFRTYVKGKDKPFENSLLLHTSDGVGYVSKSEVLKNQDAINTFNVILSRAISGGNKPGADGKYLIIPATMRVMKPGEICAETYQCIGHFDNENEAQNLRIYLSTKFVRFLMFQAITGIMVNRDSFVFVPLQDFSHPWTDEMLYEKYGLDEKEIAFIESMIRPME